MVHHQGLDTADDPDGLPRGQCHTLQDVDDQRLPCAGVADLLQQPRVPALGADALATEAQHRDVDQALDDQVADVDDTPDPPVPS